MENEDVDKEVQIQTPHWKNRQKAGQQLTHGRTSPFLKLPVVMKHPTQMTQDDGYQSGVRINAQGETLLMAPSVLSQSSMPDQNHCHMSDKQMNRSPSGISIYSRKS